jgi:tRNA (guanosine-2'-O-)-methyltransferase
VETSNLVEYLKDFVVDERVQTFLKVLNNRTRYISVLLEDVYQPHNASAVLRSCDCFGIQDIHVVEKRTEFSPDKEITMGSDKWLSISRYGGDSPLKDSLKVLRSRGYRIVATTPHIDDCQIFEFDIKKGPFVLMFGSELNGLSKSALDSADEFVKIPMYGFTESLNISVSAAIILQYFSMQIRNLDIDWRLSDAEKNEVMLSWLMRSIKDSKRIVERYSKTNKPT